MKKFFHHVITTLFLFAMTLSFSGCLETSPGPTAPFFAAPDSWFSGVTSVTNLGGSPITISVKWTINPLASKYNIYLLTNNPSTNSIGWTLIESVPNTGLNNEYIHRDPAIISSGILYTYKVNAVDFTGVEDPNQIQKSTLAFEGVKSVEILSRTSAKVKVNTAGSFSIIKITATPNRLTTYSDLIVSQSTKANFVVSATIPSANPEVTINGLIPGTTYSFKALAAVDETGEQTDGNNVVILKQTPGDSFGKGLVSETLTDYQYRNIRLMQAFGEAPNELNVTTAKLSDPANGEAKVPAELTDTVNPHERMVLIVPNPFSGDQNNTYRVTRTAGIGVSGNDAPSVFNNAAVDICRSTVSGSTLVFNDNSCVVCDHKKDVVDPIKTMALTDPATALTMAANAVLSGKCDYPFTNGIPPNFIDKSLAPPKKKYFYNIAKVSIKNSLHWVEELPLQNASDFMFAAHVPDPYMVLVQRDSVNYEMCSLLPNKSSNPKKFNRCVYSGIGARPRTTLGEPRPNLEDGYYDFGYNLLVDRHSLACRWTGSDIVNIDPSTGNAAIHALDSSMSPTGTFFTNTYTKCNVDDPKSICLSFALDATGRVNRDNTSDADYSPANKARLKDNNGNFEPFFSAAVSFVPDQAASKTKVLFNAQNGGSNCYAAFYPQSRLLTGDDTLVTTNASLVASWTSVGRLAEIAVNTTADNTHRKLISTLKAIVSQAATIDPGPIANGFSNRHRPTISGLTSEQAAALCNSIPSSYGTKRLMRRREFIVATPLASFVGEPGFTSRSDKSRIENGSDGQTLYNYERHPANETTIPLSANNGNDGSIFTPSNEYFGGGTPDTLGQNPGGCANGNAKAQIDANPNEFDPTRNTTTTSVTYNTTVNRYSSTYCNDPSGTCSKANFPSSDFRPNGASYSTSASTCDPTLTPNGNSEACGEAVDSPHSNIYPPTAPNGTLIQFGGYFTYFLNVMNEYAQIGKNYNVANSSSSSFFIGSLATNKCRSRFGIQDPFSSAVTVGGQNGRGFVSELNASYGIVLSDTFRQTSTASKTTNSPAFEPISNLQDQGAVFDYKIKSGQVLTNITISGDPNAVNTAYTFTGREGSKTISCTDTDGGTITPGSTETWFADSYFYLNANSTSQNATQACQPGNVTTLMNYTPSRNQDDFAGFLPVLGIPINKNISFINAFQDYTPFTTFLYNKEFTNDVNGFRTYNRFTTSDVTGTEIVHMTTGSGSRWSFEISQSSTFNNGGQAWCAVEAE